MAREPSTGRAQAVTALDFNERVKRLLAGKPEMVKPEGRRKSVKAAPLPAKT